MSTEKVTYYSYDRQRYPERKKELVRNGLIYLVVALPLVLVAVYVVDQQQPRDTQIPGTDIWSMVITAVIVIGLGIFSFIRQLEKYRQSYESMELAVTGEDISFSQDLHRPRFFRKNEVARTEVHHNGEIHVISHKGERLVVCKYVAGYDRLLEQLRQFGEIRVYGHKPFHEKYQWPIGFVSLGLFIVFYVARQPAVFIPAVALLGLQILWSVSLLYRRYMYLQTTRRRIAVSLFVFVLLAVTAVIKVQNAG